MRNLFEIFRRKVKVRRISNVEKLKYERSKSMSDILRPIHILSIVFGSRFSKFSCDRCKPIFAFLYSMSLCFLYFLSRFYWKDDRIIDVHETIFHITTILHVLVIFVILMMGLYRSEVSPRTVLDPLILKIFIIELINDTFIDYRNERYTGIEIVC